MPEDEWTTPSDVLEIPFAGTGAKVILNYPLPACMQSTYGDAAIVWQIPGENWRFYMAPPILSGGQFNVDFGRFYDDGTTCKFTSIETFSIFNSGPYQIRTQLWKMLRSSGLVASDINYAIQMRGNSFDVVAIAESVGQGNVNLEADGQGVTTATLGLSGDIVSIANLISAASIQFISTGIFIDADILMDDLTSMGPISIGRGVRAFVASQAASAAVGAETAMLTAASTDFAPGRAYEFIFGAELTNSVANTSTVRVRKNTAAGVAVAASFNYPRTAAQAGWVEFRIPARNNTAATVTFSPCLTLAATAGTAQFNGAATRPYFLEVRDIGKASDYANAIAIT